MAPELVAASRTYSEAVDVYALGLAVRCAFAPRTPDRFKRLPWLLPKL